MNENETRPEDQADGQSALEEQADQDQADAEQAEKQDSPPMPVDVAFNGKPDHDPSQENRHVHTETGFYDTEATDLVNKTDDESNADFDAGDSNDLKTDDGDEENEEGKDE